MVLGTVKRVPAKQKEGENMSWSDTRKELPGPTQDGLPVPMASLAHIT